MQSSAAGADRTMSPRDDITALLQAWSQGNDAARDELIPIVYGELRRRAAAYLRHERPGHTLQATALVHEAYLRLVDQKRTAWINRAQFFGIASQLMRRILVDHARAGKMAKRSGQWSRMTLDEDVAGFTDRNLNILDLDRALTRLFEFDPRKCRVAEMRFFAGLSLDEIGRILGISIATVERDWTAARAWLYAELTRKAGP
jgi:RNA polymerase sigma factor (TIGR02999 family)